MAKVAKKGRLDSESLERTLGEYISKRNVLCSDSHPSIILWAKEKEVEHHTFLANKNHVKSKCYHVQHVNSIASRYENWIKRFYGIATKYLNQYLNWHIFLIKTKHSNSQVDEISKNIVKNVLTTKIYRQIHQDYYELINSTIS